MMSIWNIRALVAEADTPFEEESGLQCYLLTC